MSTVASPITGNQLSFLPENYIERKQRRRTNALCAGLLGVVVLAIGGAVLTAHRSVARLETDSAAVDAQYADAAKRIEMVKQLQSKQRTLAGQVELTATLIDKVPRSHLLAELTNALPDGVSLLEMDMQSRVRPLPPPPTVTQAAPGTPASAAADPSKAAATAAKLPRQYDVYLKVQGIAMTDVQVATFIAHLGQSPMFKDVNLQVSEEFVVGQQKARRFAMDLQLNPEMKVGGPVVKTGHSSKSENPRRDAKGGAL